MGDKTWIELGDEGPGVWAWQAIVGVPADQKFGPKTLAAVRAWQASRNVEPDGVIGVLTRAALRPSELARGCEGLVLYAYDDGDTHWPRRPLKLNERGLYVYQDGSSLIGHPTIGRGRLLHWGDHILACTLVEADTWFDDSFDQRYYPPVKQYVPNDPAKRCSVGSFSFNLGEKDVAKLAAAHFDPKVWVTYDHTMGHEDEGLKLRRLAEIHLYYGPGAPELDALAA